MAPQDDRREIEICNLLRLVKGKTRAGVDAHYSPKGKKSIPVEVKSTTTGSVSTARDVGINHIKKWRERVWVIGFYTKTKTKLERLLILSPIQMEKWIAKIEDYISADFKIGKRICQYLKLKDLYQICGVKDKYSLSDAKKLHKRQWSRVKYFREQDLPNGYSSAKMIQILKERCLYLNARGSTLNNPHIPKRFLDKFNKINLNILTHSKKQILELSNKRFEELRVDLK
jgi:hypothetical protein